MKVISGILSAVVLALVAAAAAWTDDTALRSVVVDFAKSTGKLRALHGVNNGPVNWGIGPDLTNYHKEAGFPCARLHDCHYAGQNVVDVHFIFPVFEADADEPMYYRFAETDAYIAGMIDCGERITYRLGESIECRSRQYSNGGFYVQPPKDFAKWAKICVNIIRHYNEGWANGFHYGIQHWEIWNEPGDNISGMWPGALQQYFEMYETAARAIKAHDPSLKVGGPAACNIGFAPLVRPFLAYCRDHNAPLDFFSWHCYSESAQTAALNAVTARQWLDEYGFTKAESHITEWHPMWYSWENAVDANELGNPDPKKYATMREKFDSMRGPRAAAFVASALMLLEDSPVDMANYYTADTNPWGMFDGFGVPGRVYYTFVAFNRLMQTPNRVACEAQGGAPGFVLCAGLSDDRKTASILISNFDAPAHKVVFDLKNLPLARPVETETLAVDATHELAPAGKTTLTAEACNLAVDVSTNAVYLVQLSTRGE